MEEVLWDKRNKKSRILERLFDRAAGSAADTAIGSVAGSAADSAVDTATGSAADTAAGTATGEECLTRGQSSFKVGEGVQLTAVKDFYLPVLSQRKKKCFAYEYLETQLL